MVVSWKCPRCKNIFYSSDYDEKKKYVRCVYCNYLVSKQFDWSDLEINE